MRFLPPGGALLATDAIRRCGSDVQKMAMIDRFSEAGFDCCEQDGLLMLSPKDALLVGISCEEKKEIDWASPLHSVQALGVLWRRKQKRPLSQDGRQLILEALRLGWQPMKQAENGLEALRTRAAVMLRNHDDSGFHEAGAVLLDWCDREMGGHADEA